MQTDRSKSLDQIEDIEPGEPNFGSALVITCNRLRQKPIGDFTTEDLRIMIGQRIGTESLLPIALENLEHDPLAEGQFYKGDLLRAVLGLGKSYWEKHAGELVRLRKCLVTAMTSAQRLDPVERAPFMESLNEIKTTVEWLADTKLNG